MNKDQQKEYETILGRGFLANLVLVLLLIERGFGRWNIMDILLIICWGLNLLTYLRRVWKTMNKNQKKDLEDYKSIIEPVNYKPKVKVMCIDENLNTTVKVIDEIYNELHEQKEQKKKDFYYVADKDFQEFKDVKKVIVELAHVLGPMIPEGSNLDNKIKEWSKDVWNWNTPKKR